MKKIMSIIIAIGLSVVCCLGVFAESEEMETNVLRGAATCPSCDRGTLYDWQQKERFTTTFPCQHGKKGSDVYVADYLVKYRSCSSCSYRQELSRERVSDAVPVCIADNYKMLEEILPMEVIDHLEMYLQMGNQSTSEIAGISMMRAEACPNCNGGGIIERTFSEDYPTYTNCRHGGTGTYDVMYVTYKIHSYDCNKCNYRRILSQEITGSKTQCLLTGEVY